MAWKTRLTEALGISLPILLAPMGGAAGGKPAAAVTAGGGLGFIGAGYGDPAWIDREFAAAGNARVGCGFITWSLANQPELLDRVLAHAPAAVFLSFGDPAPFVPKIRAAGSRLICQVQTIAHTRAALAAGADIIVAQGTEAGGHGALRATMTLVPEVADLLARGSPDTLLLAAGGIADGRGLAAAIMLGADGVVMGSRLWATRECLIHPNHQTAALAANGDATVRQIAADIARGYDWPGEFTGRVLRTGFVDRWHGDEAAHRAAAGAARAGYMADVAEGRTDEAGVFVGEAIGLMDRVLPAAAVLAAVGAQAEALLRGRAARVLA
ncbi:MAG: nitronate monooxygenase [Alphaproteobacteria bacterium]|nr:nitronate monooxygenase [Alphaproteobacteria bacterium]